MDTGGWEGPIDEVDEVIEMFRTVRQIEAGISSPRILCFFLIVPVVGKELSRGLGAPAALGIANSFIFNFFFLLFLFLLLFPFLFRLVISVRRNRVRGCGIECVFVAFLHGGRRAGQSCPALHSCEGPDGLHCADGKGACVGFVRRWGCEEIGGRG